MLWLRAKLILWLAGEYAVVCNAKGVCEPTKGNQWLLVKNFIFYDGQ